MSFAGGGMLRPLEDDDRQLAATLAALSNPTRLLMLRELREPRTLREIRVPSEEGDAARPLSRQAVRQHLDRLLEIGAVVGLAGERTYGETTEYLVDHRKLYVMAEEFRGLAELRPLADRVHGMTQPATVAPKPADDEGPRLVLVRGLREGRTFPLRDGREWVIGRRREAAISLDYDAFVSSENTLLARGADGRIRVRTLEGARNGTLVNFRPLPPDEERALRHGDVVGVGRSALVYWE